MTARSSVTLRVVHYADRDDKDPAALGAAYRLLARIASDGGHRDEDRDGQERPTPLHPPTPLRRACIDEQVA